MKRIFILLCLLPLSQVSAQDSDSSLVKCAELIQAKLDELKGEPQPGKPAVLDNKKLMFSAGGNLNFLKSPNINGAYFDVGGYFPKIVSLNQDTIKKLTNPLKFKGQGMKSFFDRFGLETRLAQGRYAASQDSFSIENSQTILNDLENDSLLVLDQDYIFRREIVSSYLAFSASPTYRLFDKEKSPFFATTHFEFLRRNIVSNSNTLINSQDTIITFRNSRMNYRNIPARTRETSTEKVLFNQLIGAGFIFDFDYGKVNYRIKHVIGRGAETLNTNFRDSDWKWFYLTQFSIQYLGTGSFKIGGEVRSYFREPPLPSVYIAKTFSFKSLAELLN